MFDPQLVRSILLQVENAVDIIIFRTRDIETADFFTDSPAGAEKLDAVCMQFIAIGESLKKIDRLTDGKLLSNYPEIPWKEIIGFRDIITHHYFDVDADQVFWICRHELNPLKSALKKIESEIG